MTEALRRWADDNYLAIEEKRDDELNIIAIEGVGDFLYLHPDDKGKIIDQRFSFAVTGAEFDALYDGVVKYILFEFGGKFYYSNIKKDHLRLDKSVVFRPEFRDFKYLGTATAEELVPFVHLGVHSEYEFLNGSSNCEEWAAKAKFNGMKALGICDRNTLAGTLAFQTACLNNGLKPIIGETVTVACNYDPAADVQETFALKLYVTSPEGWRNLLLVNKAINVDYQGFIPSEELYKLGRGLICVIPPDSELNYFKSDAERCKALLEAYHTAFDQVYYQIDTVEFESEALFRAHLEAIDTYICRCRKMKAYRQTLPIVINDSYYLDREEAPLKALLNKVAGVVNAESSTQYFKNSKETILAYEEWMDVAAPLYEKIIDGMALTATLTDTIEFKIPTGIRHLPKYKFVKTTVEDAFFEKLEQGVQERLVGKVDDLDKYMNELEKECAIIVPNGLCDYFMILWDIMNWCREQGIMTGSGRGSVCGSLIAYCLYITDVDPLKYDLMFERFLNATRVSGERAKSSDSLPDVDADFPVAFRDTVKAYMSKRYGVNHVCSVGTYTRMKLKTCLKDFGKVMGVPFAVMNKLTKDIDDQIEYTWGDLFNYAATSRELFRFVQDHPELVHMTKYALTQCKTSSIHPSAVIVVPQEDEDGNPIDLFGWMPMKKMGDVLVSEWEGKYVDKSGFLKEDILGLNQLDKFSSIIKLIAKNRREQIDVNTIPFNDEEVYRYFQRGWCEDVFQFGAMGLMNYCREAKPQSLDDLIAMTALFRPGPMDVKAHETFVDIKNGRKKPKFDPGMEDITRDTYSLYTYQEQIMKAMVVGGLTPIESDECRTYIKKKNHTALAQFKEKFVNGYSNLIKSKGVVEKRAVEQASEVWEKMLAFASYGFNKCLAGSERIRRVGITRGSYAPTIEEMYEIKNRTSDLWLSHESLSDKYIRSGYGMCWSLNDEGRLVRNKIVDIRFEGVRPVYEITVRSGEKIRCTSNHRFPTPAGEMSIDSGLAVGARLYIWAGYEETNKDYSFQRGRSQNYPTKGQCGFQRQEYHPTVDFENFKRQHAGCPCDKCGKVGKRMEAHHMDGNRANNDVSNLMWLCNSCHKKIHFETLPRHRMGEKGLLTRLEEIVNIQCVGEEKVYDVEVSGNVSHTFLTDGGVVTCNSHAVAYTMMSYWSQWFKVNYPLEFWTTSLQYASKEADIPYRLVEMKKTGVDIEVRPPDINFSGDTFTCDPETNRIFFSLGKVKGVGDRALTLLKQMKAEHGEVFSFEDFITSVPTGVNRTVVLRLITAGAFDLVEGVRNPRQRLDIVKQYLERRGEELPEEFATPDAHTNAWWVFKQREITGYGEVDYTRMLNEYGLGKRMVRLYVTAPEFEKKNEGDEVCIVGRVNNVFERQTKRGDTYGVLQVEINSLIVQVTLWADFWKYQPETEATLLNRVVAVSGRVNFFAGKKVIQSCPSTRLEILQ